MLHVTPSWGQFVNPTVSDANANTAGGSSALASIDETGSGAFNNTAFGFNALQANTTGDDNTAIGNEALLANSGSANTASGALALTSNTTGNNNTASGASALEGNTTGNNNAASGSSALENNTTGNLNTASGFQALQSNIDGTSNTAIGAKALKKSTGTKNIAIGYQAGVSLTEGNNNIYIGNRGAGIEFQTIRVGTAQTQTFIAGIATPHILANPAPVEIDIVTGQLGLGVSISSARYKRDIAPMGTQSEKVLTLRPVTFAYRDDAQAVTRYGLIAEEVAAVYPELVTRTASGEVQTVKYQELIPMLLNELQRQRQEFQQTLQTQQQALQSQGQLLQRQGHALERQQQELTDLRALVGSGREATSLSR